MLLCFRLVLVPGDDGAEVSLHDGLRGPVGPLRAEHEDLRALLQVLLVHVGLLLADHVGGKGLGARGRAQQPGTRAQTPAQA